jgi:hypothetical protein
MSLNAYINDFKDKGSFKEKCFVCKKFLNDNYFTLPATQDINTHDQTRAYIKENRMCSIRCMNHIVLETNKEEHSGKEFNEYRNRDL